MRDTKSKAKADGRRTALTLPNGVTIGYNWDAASQLIGINYQLGNTLLGNLAYGYDLAGRRISVGGSYAQTGLPGALASVGFNADNQLTQFGSSSLTYDAIGNLTSDGRNTYTWDARNHLVSISGAASASFNYDPFGRRVSKTIGAATTGYLYDGPNPVQELSGGAPVANLLTGFGTDERFQRTDATGPADFLTDALGSTLALTGPSGNTIVRYTYDPYGNTTMTGSSTNPYQYTGRENDATGLYFYRARYYSPLYQRFIGEDPVGFSGGPNFYRYASNNPASFVDAFGYLGMSFNVTYRQLRGFWQWFWYNGSDEWGRPKLSATCERECEGPGYHLSINIVFPILISYTGPGVKAHEEKHNAIEEQFLRRQAGKYEAFEKKTYRSLALCRYYRDMYVTGFPNNGRTPDLMIEILQDMSSSELISAEREVDSWLDSLFYH